jgi:hypothetical protein
MSLSDVAGIFSRYFIVGFFSPAFFAVFAFAQLNPEHWLRPHGTADVAALGGIALLLGLVLVGIRDSVHAAYSGYRPALLFGVAPSDAEIRQRWEDPFGGFIARRLQKRQTLRVRALRARASTSTDAAALLWARYGRGESIRPTRLGNRARVFDDYMRDRYRLTPAAWQRIQGLLTETEQQLLTEQDTDQRFFLNASIGALLAALPLTAMWGWEAADSFRGWELAAALGSLLAGLLLSWLAYCSALDPAEGLATRTCAAIDAHVADLYTKFEIKPGKTRAEQEKAGAALTDFIERGVAIPDELRA